MSDQYIPPPHPLDKDGGRLLRDPNLRFTKTTDSIGTQLQKAKERIEKFTPGMFNILADYFTYEYHMYKDLLVDLNPYGNDTDQYVMVLHRAKYAKQIAIEFSEMASQARNDANKEREG